MQQTISINTPITIQVPEEFKVVNRDEYDRLIEHDLLGKTWTMDDLRERLNNVDPRWIKDNILYPFRSELDIRCGGFVVYPRTKGKPWKFQALKMAQFLDDHWELFMAKEA